MEDDTFPLVSVLMPCYNHEQFVEASLNSILEETYPNKEIIIINDGSSDNSNEVIQKWVTRNDTIIPIKFISQNNQGICKTLNNLIREARGEYYVPLASDDMLCCNGIMERIKILQANRDKLVLISDASVVNEHAQQIMESSMTQYCRANKEKYYSVDTILHEVLVNPSISGPVVMMHKSIFDLIGLYREDLRAEDWYFYQRAAAKGKMLFVDEVYSKYRVHSSNSSGVIVRKSPKMASTIIKTYATNISFMPSLFFKLIALKEMIKWIVRYFYYRII